MAVVGECRGWRQETTRLRRWRERPDLFPVVPERRRFNRRRRWPSWMWRRTGTVPSTACPCRCSPSTWCRARRGRTTGAPSRHTFPGLRARSYTKLAAHTLCVYLNRLLGQTEFLQIKGLAFPAN